MLFVSKLETYSTPFLKIKSVGASKLRNAKVRLLRDQVVIYEGDIASLRRFKDDASEVRQGFECGIGLDRYHDIKEGDIIEAYRMVEIAPEL